MKYLVLKFAISGKSSLKLVWLVVLGYNGPLRQYIVYIVLPSRERERERERELIYERKKSRKLHPHLLQA